MTDSVIPPAPAPVPAPSCDPGSFGDQDLVYVDPDSRTVVARVEWNRSGNPKSMPYAPPAPDAKDKGERKRSGRKYYPWGTYRSMKGVFRLEGKQKRSDPTRTLDDVMKLATEQPFWD
jgi:hypothetical protein